jgi:hypothetical protein
LDGHDELLTIAEIAVGLAGLSGVIAVFIQRGGLSPADRLRFLALFGTAFAALVLAFVPIALAYSGFKNQDIWQISSVTMVFAGLVGLVPLPFGQRTIRKEFKTTTSLPTVFLLVPSGINLAIQLVNAGGWIWQPNFVPYLIGMLVYLYAIAFFFVIIVLFRPTA